MIYVAVSMSLKGEVHLLAAAPTQDMLRGWLRANLGLTFIYLTKEDFWYDPTKSTIVKMMVSPMV
jgi:hypothetical protein